MQRLLAISRLAGDLAEARLDRWRPLPGVESVMAEIKRYLFRAGGTDRNAVGWIILSGPHGTGKSHLLAALVRHFAEAGRGAVYTTAQHLLQELRDSLRDEPVHSRLWADVQNAQVLAIDELEKFNGTPWAQEQVFALLSHRYDAWGKGLTLLGTNRDCRQPGFRVLPTDGPWGGTRYLESRIADGRNLLITAFWEASDVRPILREPL